MRIGGRAPAGRITQRCRRSSGLRSCGFRRSGGRSIAAVLWRFRGTGGGLWRGFAEATLNILALLVMIGIEEPQCSDCLLRIEYSRERIKIIMNPIDGFRTITSEGRGRIQDLYLTSGSEV